MAPPKSDSPVITNPVLHTLQSYEGEQVRVIDKDGNTSEGTLAVVQETLIILHVQNPERGHLEPFGVYNANIESIQKIGRPLRVVS